VYVCVCARGDVRWKSIPDDGKTNRQSSNATTGSTAYVDVLLSLDVDNLYDVTCREDDSVLLQHLEVGSLQAVVPK
jgi:hypothetical protein